MPSLSVKFDNVVFPLDHEIDIRGPQEWLTSDFTQATVRAIFVAAIYDGVAGAARDGLFEFLKSRVPSNLGAFPGDAATGAGDCRRHRGASGRQCPA